MKQTQLQMTWLVSSVLIPKAIIKYLEGRELPTDERLEKSLVLESSRFTLQGGVLFYVDAAWENSLRLAVPADSQKKLMKEIHGGSLSGHFAARSMYNILARAILVGRNVGGHAPLLSCLPHLCFS